MCAAALSPLHLAVISDAAQAQAGCPAAAPGPTAYIDSTASDVLILRAAGGEIAAARDLLLCPGDEVVTGATGRVAIRFDEKRTVVRLDGNSRTRILTGGAAEGDVSLLSGVLYFLSSVRTHFQVDTPYIVAGIDGTEALVGVRPAEALALAAVREGVVSAFDKQSPMGTLQVSEGEAAFRSASVAFQKAPIGDLPPPFRDLLIVSSASVDWAVYYPPILFADQSGDARIRRAVELLSSGEYDRAAAELDAASGAEPATSAALRTIIEIGRDRLAEAARFAALALAADPGSAQAQIAASYVRQSEGDLKAALAFAHAAERLAPGDAYVLARLAELQLTVGDRRAGLATAERSLAIRRTPLALFVAGLSQLAAARYAIAEALFREAIALDAEAPLARLGLGLAYIRQGDTAAGAWEIERAVAHDPRRASLRNWLGRAYFDEGLTHKAAEQFNVSKQADPQDPTPYLFSALERYAANRPIEALRELYEAEARSRARGVLRSERGLAEDAATVGAALGRIYAVLGFEQLAIVEGAEAVDADPSNPGAHRFLAEAYRARPDTEIAQTSELLVSQLLSPPSKTPVQPQLAETGLALLDTTGPARVSFAEFAPLFDEDGLRLNASGLAGTQKTFADEVAVTGLYRNASVSVGQFHYETDGFRDNNDLRHDIFAGVATLALSPEFSLFGEFRHRETEGGDRRLNFDIDAFDPNFRSRVERDVARVGFHAEPSPDSDILGIVSGARLTSDSFTAVDFLDPPNGIESSAEDKALSGELQYLFTGDAVRATFGGTVSRNRRHETGEAFGEPFPDFDATTRYLNGYGYVYLDAPERVTWTIGGSITDYRDLTGETTRQFNPKIGVSAELGDNWKLRAAYLRNVKPDLVSDQTIEPTTIAGFNQFYDGFNGSTLNQIGGGVDGRLGDRLAVGAEALERRWDIPGGLGPDAETKEQVYRGYVDVVLSDSLALSTGVSRETSQSDAAFDFADWDTTTIPVRISYFGEIGLFGSFGLELVDHDFANPGISGEDRFTIFGGTLGYRFPKSIGIVSLEVQNLFDEPFHFQNRSIRPDLNVSPRFAPERTVLARGTFRF